MRAATRLLASVKPSRFLETGAPTGLTGLLTHGAPRSTLLYHYKLTLDKLQQIPASSVYRQSTEALTKHRLQVIEESKPAGWDEWYAQVKAKVAEDPTAYDVHETASGQIAAVPRQLEIDYRTRAAEWGGENVVSFPEGIRTERERAPYVRRIKGGEKYTPERQFKDVKFDPEPLYTAEAISDIESKMGAGLIEEVIAVAAGEHKLVDTMIEAKVWEPLEEQAPEGQWTYFERGTHTGTT